MVVNEIVLRGCVGDWIVRDHSKCQQTDIVNCTTCSDGDKCNNGIVHVVKPAKQIEKCYSDHENNGNQLQSIECPAIDEKPTGCFSRMDGDVGDRYGCVSNLSEDEFKKCEYSESCTICNENNCNIAQRECFLCNSKDDPDCVKPTLKNQIDKCEPTQDRCIVGMDMNGVVHRRCAKSFEADFLEFKGSKPFMCVKNFCNSIEYPTENRLKCLRRDTIKSSPKSSTLEFCKYFVENDECYSFYVDHGNEFITKILKSFYNNLDGINFRARCCTRLYE